MRILTALSIFLTLPAWASAEDPVLVPYGFVNAAGWWADQSVASISSLNKNFSAPVAAGLIESKTDQASLRNRFSLQIQQSRFGVQVMPKAAVRGKLEFDLFNANFSNPAASSLPRIRIAKIEWQAGENLRLAAGLDWDLFNGGINPFTHNYVGNYFQGGNVGFIRQQLMVFSDQSDFEYGFALGMAQNSTNPPTAPFGSSNSDSEFANLPSLSARVIYKQAHAHYGVSGIFASQISPSAAVTEDLSYRGQAFGLAFFADLLTARDLSFRAKLYWGQDLKDIGAIGLGQLSASPGSASSHSLHEWGGFFTAYQKFAETWAFTLGLGFAQIAESEVVLRTLTRNWQWRLGLDYNIPDTKAKAFVETTHFASRYQLASGPTDPSAFTTELGLELGF